MTITKAQWTEIEQELSGRFGNVNLKCDGRNITLEIQRDRQRLVVAVFIDGWIEGKNFITPSDDAKKFWNHQVRFLYSARKREEAQKALRRRYMKSMPDIKAWYEGVLTQKVESWSPYFPSAKAVCRHLAKSCQDIELIEL